jgi:ParB family chromosome partitioning protein
MSGEERNKQNSILAQKIAKLKNRTKEEGAVSTKDTSMAISSPPKREEVSQQEELIMIPIDKIIPNPYQPRKNFKNIEELALSIREKGLLQAIAVTKRDDDYIIIAGERRFRACKLNSKSEDKEIASKFAKIKAVVFNNITNQELKELAVVENIHREDMTMFESADAFKSLKDDGYTIRDIELITGISKSKVQRFLKISDLSQEVRSSMQNFDIQPGIAILLAEADISDAQKIQLLEKATLRNSKSKMETAILKLVDSQNNEKVEKNVFKEVQDLFSKASTPIKKRAYLNLSKEKREEADQLLQSIIDAKRRLEELAKTPPSI